MNNKLLDCSVSPPNFSLLCILHIVYILNRLSTESLQWETPLDAATGFHWYEAVHFKHYISTSKPNSYPSESQERIGRIIGDAEHKGVCLTFLVLD
jgi:hypothetical protein